MLRISVASRGPPEIVLKLEGQVAREWVPLLDQEVRHWLGQRPRVVLDLDGVQHLDHAALDLLERWHHQGVGLRGGSLFVKALLESRGLALEPDLSAQ